MTSIKTGKVFQFGPDDALVGTITEAPGKPSQVGAVLWGMGLAEVQAARLLARLGIVAMQVRLADPAAAEFDRQRVVYDASGIQYVKAAMSLLAEERGVQRFILMGNCSGANLSFNTALEDQRVMGLILTNLHFSEVQTFSMSFGRKAMRFRSWQKLLKGQINLKWLKAAVLRKLGLAGEQALISQWGYKKDLVLPADFDRRLINLAERGVKTLMVFAHTEASLGYIKTTYGKTVERLQAAQALELSVLSRDSHIISRDEVAVDMLNETIAQWGKKVLAAQGAAPSGEARVSGSRSLTSQG